jgi:hypothetical protein
MKPSEGDEDIGFNLYQMDTSAALQRFVQVTLGSGMFANRAVGGP